MTVLFFVVCVALTFCYLSHFALFSPDFHNSPPFDLSVRLYCLLLPSDCCTVLDSFPCITHWHVYTTQQE